ncbi:MAG: carboxypeptidase-like regulatory domain-containing protein, partial [Methanosarcinaceae archaeon]|nr:carboxypeptidase-like regulatory domain-containing protein [Methanosarcinaceae archaeon]
MRYIKNTRIFGLVLVLLIMCIAPAGAGSFEFVANTTSDASGNFIFSDVPNGDYSLSSVIYSSAMGGMWLTNVTDLTIVNGTPVDIDFVMRKNSANDHDAMLSYLDRTTISGKTVSKTGSAKVGTDLVLTDLQDEFIANTTSNDSGNYFFTNVPNGDYRLSSVIYSSSMGGMWLTNVTDLTIVNGTSVDIDFAMRKNSANDHDAILAYLDRTTISG